ncbi:MAG: extracellular solute-binding protein family 5, peptide/nickel transport system substrate-binding protein [Parcubacteria group bacterium GW2011_GWC1_45_14]|nr:MAG: Extracellular solute-binding protein [Candidatus Moranbacteria bacterium GW2011_GWC2_45_10]KKT95088.1 MAG: extracellular solute-binding protein family 5, peptide/nickel transport system substrate-binding protein [Parcubacteria group bacterium GW2011_GWC1_45_14]
MLPGNWLAVSKVLSFREKLVVSFFVLIIMASSVFWLKHVYFGFTVPIPKLGGEYAEGMVGQPIYVNPLLSQTSDSDADLVALVYSGLFGYDKEGKIRNDLAERYEVSEDKKVYTVYIRKDAKWHDGQNLDIEDVVFTFNILKDPTYKSPLRQNWQGVTVSQVDESSIKFELKNPYFGFLENLTVGILPKHIWQDIPAERFALAEKNLRPIGSGPYMFADFQKDSNGNIITYKLSAFKGYHGGAPYISRINFNFYPDDSALISAFKKKEVAGISDVSPEKLGDVSSSKNIQVKELVIPRYFALFINQTKSVALAYDEVRKALAISVNRQEIVDTVLGGKGIPLYSPLFPQMNGHTDMSGDYAYNPEEARRILDGAGWSLNNESGVREKDGNRFEFEIVTTDWPELMENAELLKRQWGEIGAKVDIKVLSVSDFQQNYIRTREYPSLLFGQALSFNPDLYSFWHSSNKRDPGLNLALFDNKDADTLLESIRQETDDNKRAESYRQFSDIIKEKNPAIFLYSQYYLYPISKAVKGNEVVNINAPSWRFADISKWYIKTSRVWK